jgi:hypothetical protein
MVCQYASVISLLFGFETYLVPTLSWSFAITMIFPISILVIMGLTIKELLDYIKSLHIMEENKPRGVLVKDMMFCPIHNTFNDSHTGCVQCKHD